MRIEALYCESDVVAAQSCAFSLLLSHIFTLAQHLRIRFCGLLHTVLQSYIVHVTRSKVTSTGTRPCYLKRVCLVHEPTRTERLHLIFLLFTSRAPVRVLSANISLICGMTPLHENYRTRTLMLAPSLPFSLLMHAHADLSCAQYTHLLV
jgi:hypothetical protein